MRLLACQIDVPPVTDAAARDRHVRRTVDRIAGHLAAESCDLVVLPELCTIDYSQAAFGRLDELAEPLDGPSVSLFGALAREHGTFVSFSMPRAADGDYLISEVIIDPSGRLVGHYDKLHIAQFGASMEKDRFKAGSNLLVVEIAGTRVAPVICYDFRFPELVRHLCIDHGVDLILHPVAFQRDTTFASWHAFAVCRALENQIYFLSINRAGAAYGSSIFCPPWIDGTRKETVFPAEETFRFLKVDHSVIEQVRQEFPFRRDKMADYRTLDLTSG